MKLFKQKLGTILRDEVYELGALMLKLGYPVRIGKEPPPGKQTAEWFIELLEDVQK